MFLYQIDSNHVQSITSLSHRNPTLHWSCSDAFWPCTRRLTAGHTCSHWCFIQHLLSYFCRLTLVYWIIHDNPQISKWQCAKHVLQFINFLGCFIFRQAHISGWWWLEHSFYDFPYIGNNHANWRSFFSEGLKPPTSLLVHVHVFECYRIYFCLWRCAKAGLHRRESQWWNWYDVVLRCCGWSLENYTQTDFFQNRTCYMAIWSLFNGWYIMLNIMPYSEYSCQASLSNCWYIIFYDVIIYGYKSKLSQTD